MSEPTQLARAHLHHGTREVSEYVLGQASHALVLTDWVLPNPTYHQRVRVFEATAFPLEIIDRFFASVRIVTSMPTGYAQILVDPLGWARSYTADLTPMEGITIRRYPPTLLPISPYLDGEFSFISETQVQDVREIFAGLSSLQNTANASRLNLVVKRLNGCYMREEEEDTILDATIGLEMLLSDGDAQEVTHKLALRLAALSSTLPGYGDQGSTIVRNVKSTIYPYRSAVVHGDVKKAKKKREVKTETGGAIPAVKLAVEYLGMAVRAVTKHPEYLDPAVIDEQLLLGRLARGPSA